MRLHTLIVTALVALGPLTAPQAMAETAIVEGAGKADVAALADTMQLGPLFEVLGEEGRAYGASLEAEMFPGGGGPRWMAAVEAIYDVPTLREGFDAALEAEIAGHPALPEMLAFFGSDLGQRILTLEVDARRALLDEGVKEAAQVTSEKMQAERDPRIKLIGRLIEANDLLEMNVAGALTGNLAFLQGMAREGTYGADVDDEQMMSDVWGQEDQVRTDTSAWLYSYMALAYQPLSDAELEAYIDFSETPAGQRLNAALFAAFDVVFKQVSYNLGRAAGRAALGSDI